MKFKQVVHLALNSSVACMSFPPMSVATLHVLNVLPKKAVFRDVEFSRQIDI